MCFYLRNWQVTFLLYTLGVFISEYTAKAFTEPRDYRVVFLIQSPEVPKGTFRECKRSPRVDFLQSYKPLENHSATCKPLDSENNRFYMTVINLLSKDLLEVRKPA